MSANVVIGSVDVAAACTLKDIVGALTRDLIGEFETDPGELLAGWNGFAQENIISRICCWDKRRNHCEIKLFSWTVFNIWYQFLHEFFSQILNRDDVKFWKIVAHSYQWPITLGGLDKIQVAQSKNIINRTTD